MSTSHAADASSRYRLLLAFAAMPFVTALLAFVGFPLVWFLGGHDGRLHDPIGTAAGFAAITGFLGLIVTAAGAVPLVHWLLKRGPVPLAQAIAAGVVLGNAPFAFYVGCLILPATLVHLAAGTLSERLLPASHLVAGTLRALAIGSVIGGVSALVFWFVGIRPRAGTPSSQPDPRTTASC